MDHLCPEIKISYLLLHKTRLTRHLSIRAPFLLLITTTNFSLYLNLSLQLPEINSINQSKDEDKTKTRTADEVLVAHTVQSYPYAPSSSVCALKNL
jgi:hypothetical protein